MLSWLGYLFGRTGVTTPQGPQGQKTVMPNNRNLWHLCVWVAIVLLTVIAWWATRTVWGMGFGAVAGSVAFYFANRQRRVGFARRS
jgi:Protein of unknown function (DUF2878)